MNLEEANKAIEADRKDRGEKARVALEALCKEFNVELGIVSSLGDNQIPVQSLLAVPVQIIILPK